MTEYNKRDYFDDLIDVEIVIQMLWSWFGGSHLILPATEI